jgi:hypothetical protein
LKYAGKHFSKDFCALQHILSDYRLPSRKGRLSVEYGYRPDSEDSMAIIVSHA